MGVERKVVGKLITHFSGRNSLMVVDDVDGH